MDHVKRKTRGFTGSSVFDPRLLNLVVSLCKKVLPECGESPTFPPAPAYTVLFRDLVWPEWKVDRDGTFLGNATGCVGSVVEFVFSVDDVFS